VAGMLAMRSLEGRPDLFGRPLTGASIVPIADLIASAAMLVCGEGAEGIPVVIARGLVDLVGAGNAAELIRPPARDLFAVPDRDYS
jgi:coenzyme F420-0:L-glutamate ligase / coenzyme F420-1:gamma-L-glutamate ligase